jgi:hypothetical protein
MCVNELKIVDLFIVHVSIWGWGGVGVDEYLHRILK